MMKRTTLLAASTLAFLAAGIFAVAGQTTGGGSTGSGAGTGASGGTSGTVSGSSRSLGQPSRIPGQPGAGSTAPANRPAIGAGSAGKAGDPNALPPALRDRPASPPPQQPQFLGSGGKAPDGSIPGGSLVALTEHERNKIRDIISAQSITQERTTGFKLVVGAKVPENIPLRSLPPDVVELVPKYKEFGFLLADDRIVIVQRSTREIDTMIELRS
jgi:hypothetical protein